MNKIFMKIGNSTIVIVRVFWSIERVKKQASLYGFMTSFGSLNSGSIYSIISKCNKTYSRTTAIIFQRVVKRETLYLVVLAIVQMLHPLQKLSMLHKDLHCHKFFYNGNLFVFVYDFAP